MEFFQVRKNKNQLIRIYRGPYEGLDITRIQIWWRRIGDTKDLPGKTVAFASELIPGIIEGLLLMAERQPRVDSKVPTPENDEALPLLAGIFKAHRQPLHWEMAAKVLKKEHPKVGLSKWQ